MVCFESVFPGLTRKLANEGAEFLFVLTNDAWFLDTAAIHQHASMSALRAIETRRYVAQASNTGVSAIYDPSGRLSATVRPLTKSILYGEMRPNRAKDFLHDVRRFVRMALRRLLGHGSGACFLSEKEKLTLFLSILII